MAFLAVLAFVLIFMWLKSVFLGAAVAGLLLFGGVLQYMVEWNLFMVGLLLIFGFGMLKFARDLFA